MYNTADALDVKKMSKFFPLCVPHSSFTARNLILRLSNDKRFAVLCTDYVSLVLNTGLGEEVVWKDEVGLRTTQISQCSWFFRKL